MRNNRPLALLSLSALVVSVLTGVALLTVGWPLLSGRAFNTPPAARLVTVTSTVLATSPVSPVASGTQVALTATVTPAVAVGTVQFKDGTTNLGNPVMVSNGTASGTTSMLAVGSRQLTAVFTPTDTAYGPSTSPAVMFVVTGAPATSTTLVTSPAFPVVQGAPVTLTATVAPATAVGAVQFKDGATNVGNPVAVSNGTASGSTSTLGVGSHQLTAVFTPLDPGAFSPSTSPPVTFVITGSTGAVATSTVLATSPASPVAQGTPVTLTATVTPATAPGSVQFKDGATNLGNPVIVSNGTASASTSTLAAGGHQLTAVFTPADPAIFGPSTSPVLAFEVTDPALADLAACARVGQNCPIPRAGASRLSHFNHPDAGTRYASADRLRRSSRAPDTSSRAGG